LHMKTISIIISLVFCLGLSASDWDSGVASTGWDKQLWDGVVERNPNKVKEALDHDANTHQKVNGYNLIIQLFYLDFREAYKVNPGKKIDIKLSRRHYHVLDGGVTPSFGTYYCDPFNPTFLGTTDEEIKPYLDNIIQNRLAILKLLVAKSPELLFEVRPIRYKKPGTLDSVAIMRVLEFSVEKCQIAVEYGVHWKVSQELEKTQKYFGHGQASLITADYIEYLLSVKNLPEDLEKYLEFYLIHWHQRGITGYISYRERARGSARHKYWWEVSEKIFTHITARYPALQGQVNLEKSSEESGIEMTRHFLLKEGKR
jgi:hypothetical protein